MDDILVSSEDDPAHLDNLSSVLSRLLEAGLLLRQDKYCFMQPEVIYCGYSINGEGVYPVLAKVDTIKNTPAPRDVTQLHAFLGIMNYYHKFLPNVATYLEPLHELLRKGQKWKWNQEQQKAFAKAKEPIYLYISIPI
jgi:hypothetical protein